MGAKKSISNTLLITFKGDSEKGPTAPAPAAAITKSIPPNAALAFSTSSS